MSDLDLLRREASLPDIAVQFGAEIEKDGHEFVGLCPLHSEKTPSFTIFPGKDHVWRFHCFGCGACGDVIDFVAALKGVETGEAIRILRGDDSGGGRNVKPRKIEGRDAYEGIAPLPEPPEQIHKGKPVRLYNPKRAGQKFEWGRLTPSMVFPYRRSDGSVFGYVLRREFKDGGKETPMVMWVRLPDGKECWCRYPFPRPRPLYGLHKLRDGQVIVVEGEKCRDALAGATGRTVVAWPAGTYGIRHTDWRPLQGRTVVIWPDADGPGTETGEQIAAILAGLDCTVRVMDVLRVSK